MTIVAVILACGVFLAALRVSRIYPVTLDVVAVLRKASEVIRNDDLGDDEKERLARQYAVHLLKRFVHITFLCAAILAMPLLVLLALDALKIVPFQEATALLLRWQVIIGTTGIALSIWVVRHVIRRSYREGGRD